MDKLLYTNLSKALLQTYFLVKSHILLLYCLGSRSRQCIGIPPLTGIHAEPIPGSMVFQTKYRSHEKILIQKFELIISDSVLKLYREHRSILRVQLGKFLSLFFPSIDISPMINVGQNYVIPLFKYHMTSLFVLVRMHYKTSRHCSNIMRSII